jgi:hypothetical protein
MATADHALSEHLSGRLDALWERQLLNWPMLTRGTEQLRQARTKPFQIGPFRILAQWNPARLASALAASDVSQNRARPCILCDANRPVEQEKVPYRDEWAILCNPAPILEPHYTIVTRCHQPQRIAPALETIINLARDLADTHTVFYNGPASGASAPDHLHLQAIPADALPVEQALAENPYENRLEQAGGWIEWSRPREVPIGFTTCEGPTAIVFESDAREPLLTAIRQLRDALSQAHPADPETRLNFFAAFRAGRWRCWLNPRIALRPSFYGQGADEFLISPGCIDVAGMLVVPRRDDFDRLDETIVRRLYGEVLRSRRDLARLRERLPK